MSLGKYLQTFREIVMSIIFRINKLMRTFCTEVKDAAVLRNIRKYLSSTTTTRGADKSLARPGRKQATATEEFEFHYILFIIIIGGILVLYIYKTRLASNKIVSPSNKIHQEVGRAKDLPVPR